MYSPYEVVSSPQTASYGGPSVDWSMPIRALTGAQTPGLTAQYGRLLRQLMGRTGAPGAPLSLAPPNPGPVGPDPYGIDNPDSAYNQGLIGRGGNPVLFGSLLY